MVVLRRRSWLLVLLLGLILAGCTSGSPMPVTPTVEAMVPAPATDAPATDAPFAGTDEPAPESEPTVEVEVASPTATTPPVADAPTIVAPATMPPPVEDLSLSADGVFLHPVPDIYAGDPVTFYILAGVPEDVEPNDVTVRIEVRDQFTLQGALNGRNLAGEAIGLFA
jgi:hypothetical protein